MRKRRFEYFKDKKCVQCGATEKLELDHIDPTKKADHRIWSWNEEKRGGEIEKCQVLCRDCHWKKTYQQRGYGPQNCRHGTHHMYKYYGCRCQLCRDKKNATKRKWRATVKELQKERAAQS